MTSLCLETIQQKWSRALILADSDFVSAMRIAASLLVLAALCGAAKKPSKGTKLSEVHA